MDLCKCPLPPRTEHHGSHSRCPSGSKTPTPCRKQNRTPPHASPGWPAGGPSWRRNSSNSAPPPDPRGPTRSTREGSNRPRWSPCGGRGRLRSVRRKGRPHGRPADRPGVRGCHPPPSGASPRPWTGTGGCPFDDDQCTAADLSPDQVGRPPGRSAPLLSRRRQPARRRGRAGPARTGHGRSEPLDRARCRAAAAAAERRRRCWSVWWRRPDPPAGDPARLTTPCPSALTTSLGRDRVVCTQKDPSCWYDGDLGQASSSRFRRRFRVTAHNPAQHQLKRAG
ncbi:hypothetical protein P3T39_006463 [Kitasatospora sp. GP82]|nr:hypothetical protein [Kitasatospora sp. GP82]